MTHTKEEKKAYFSNLREQWKKSKELAQADQTAKALYNETGGKYSYTSFYFTLLQMRTQQLDGIPYIDAKTFKGWREAGFSVKRGEKSLLSGITWIDAHADQEDAEKLLFPKVYHLFNRKQVETLS